MTETRPPTFRPGRPAADRPAVVIDLFTRRPYRMPPAAQPNSAWYHDAALREPTAKPPRFV